MKGRGQVRPLVFSANLKVLKIAKYWHVGFVLPEKHCFKVFARGCSSFSRNNVTKISVFQAAPFRDLLLNGKQKKHYYCFVERQTGRPFIVYKVKIKSHKS